MIRRLLAGVLSVWPGRRPAPTQCGCHPWFHDLGVHAPTPLRSGP